MAAAFFESRKFLPLFVPPQAAECKVIMSKIIMGIQVQQRSKTVPDVQSILTEYGCYITTRIGLHEAASGRNSDCACSNMGIILLEFIDGADNAAKELEAKLLEGGNVTVKKMVF
jgi:hypothetical protein